jgi:2-methylisocitrate lyase-like PEP mutase family enzyme
MLSQLEKARIFRALHEREGAFLIPNPWDRGSARLLQKMGFEAIATSSAGFAWSQGKPDTAIGRDAMLAHVAEVAAAVDLPVSGDLENGYGDAPETAAETIQLSAAGGLVGGSIEDATGRPGDPIYEINLAVDRVRAAAKAAHALSFPFTLTARCENFLHGRPDLNDTIQRLRAYQDAGADVLYAPGLRRLEDIAQVVRSVDRPVNVLASPGLTVSALAEIGVRRISVGSTFARVALTAFERAAREALEQGTFSRAEDAISYAEFNDFFRES